MSTLSPTLSRAIEGFILHKTASGLSPNTIRNYKNQLKRFKEWANNSPIDEITPQHIEEFFQYLREGFQITHVCSNVSVPPRKLSTKTIKNAWGCLSTFWKWTSKEFEFINPFKIPQPKAHTKPVHPLSMDEVESLLKACDFSDKRKPDNRSSYHSRRPTRKRDRALILTFLDTGIRVGELCGIEMGNLDLDSGRILVTGKGEKSRFVYLGKQSRRAIWAYIAERFPHKDPKADEPLFVDQWDIRRLTGDSVRNLLKRLGLKASIESVHPHRFRHTFAIQFLRNGGDVFTLQQLLGHSSLDMVKNYVTLAQLDLEEAHRNASPVDNWRLR